MNQSVVYCGVDIAKDKLDACLAQQSATFSNCPEGHQKFLGWMDRVVPDALTHVHVICEATGGYEQPLVACLLPRQYRLSVVPPKRVRDLANSLGIFAKTDRIDAKLLVRFGEVAQPRPACQTSAQQKDLAQLMTCRQQLQDQLRTMENRVEHMQHGVALKAFANLVSTLKAELTLLDKAIDELVKSCQQLHDLFWTYRRIKGVGRLTSLAALAYLPEAGTLTDGQAASLAGVAPRNKDSGKSSKPRSTGGGRPRLRTLLYMAALTASRDNPVLKPYYKRLKADGKPSKVALTALMRKIIILINKLAKNPNLSLV